MANQYYQDDPEARKRVWSEAPRASDKYGNPLIKIGNYWCGYNFNRFWQIVMEETPKDDYVLVVRVADGRYFSRPASVLRHGRTGWRRRVESGWYCFVDPSIQMIYP